MDWPECKYRTDTCEIASTLAQSPIVPERGDCLACKTFDQDINPITIAISGLPPGDKVGTGLKNIFSWFISMPPNCQCVNRAAMMDAWGAKKCLEYLPTILGWLRESALDNGYPYSEFVVTSLLKAYLRSHIKS